MPRYYTYLISSLPALVFDAKPPFSWQGFLGICRRLISAADLECLEKMVSLEDCQYDGDQPTLRRWFQFDRDLRNELVKIRASRKHLDPGKYLRAYNSGADASVMHTVQSASRNPSVIEAEKSLDLERWRILDEFSVGHYFDIDFLIVYAHKLLILEKWEKIKQANKQELLQSVLGNQGNASLSWVVKK